MEAHELNPLPSETASGDNGAGPNAGRVGSPEASAGCGSVAGDQRATPNASTQASSAGCAVAPASGRLCASRAEPPKTVREFERALRAMGYSRPLAESIARHGFEAAHTDASGQPDESDLHVREALAALARTLRGDPS